MNIIADDQMDFCMTCDKELPLDKLIKIGQNYYCKKCAKDITLCKYCGKDIEMTYSQQDGDEYVCCDCWKKMYSECWSCENFFPDYKMDKVSFDGKVIYLCEKCYLKYTQMCSDCGKRFCIYDDASYHITHDEKYICSDCYEKNYHVCSQCRNIFHKNQIHRVRNEYICDNCYEKINGGIDPQIQDTQKIYNHDDKIKVKFYKQNDQQTNEYIGIQIEICATNPNGLYYFIKQACKNKRIIFKRDGSIGAGGIQINSQPCTYKFHIGSFGWDKIFSLMNQYGLTDTTNCGIHFHISKDNFTKDQEKVIDYFVNNCVPQLSAIGGRDYSKTNDDGLYCKAIKKALSDYGKNYIDRYEAVNFENKNTIQLRFPKTTTNYRKFVQMLDMVHNICKLTKMFTFEQISLLNETDLKNVWRQLIHNL